LAYEDLAMDIFGGETIFWFALGFLFLAIEVATPGIVFVFFGLGAWLVVVIKLFFPISQFFQVLIFVVSSVIFLFLLRRHLKALFYKGSLNGKKVDSLSERMVANNYLGREAEVIKDIRPGYPGIVELNGTNWTARAETSFLAGQRVNVGDISGVVATVEKLNSPSLDETKEESAG
jgi:membrane protein implicated in regulation of membrane protease activity